MSCRRRRGSWRSCWRRPRTRTRRWPRRPSALSMRASRIPTSGPRTTRTTTSAPDVAAGATGSGPPVGVLVVDKPAGWTSHQVGGRARRVLGTRKVGHAGTLDPMATGVLVLGVGRATRLLGQLALTDKAYDATIRLGQATVTDDAEGELTESVGVEGVSDEAIET